MRTAHGIVWAAALLLAGAAARAAGVTPAGETVPANLLRVELDLRGLDGAEHRVRLLRDGAEVEGALLDLPLQSRDGRRVTWLLHPGRIKTDVGPQRRLGPALRAGDVVTLVVDGAALRKTWRVTDAERAPLAIAGWPLSRPRAGTRALLDLQLRAAFNASAADLIAVADAAGRRVPGRARLSGDGGHWQFHPAQPWREGRYTLHLHPELEDAAGNRRCAPFEARALSALDCGAEGRRPFVVARSTDGDGETGSASRP